jgi:hypothetical protein
MHPKGIKTPHNESFAFVTGVHFFAKIWAKLVLPPAADQSASAQALLRGPQVGTLGRHFLRQGVLSALIQFKNLFLAYLRTHLPK